MSEDLQAVAMPRSVIDVRSKRRSTGPALVMVNNVLANPPLYATSCEPQIVQQFAVPSVHLDFVGGAPRALPRPRGVDRYVHRQNLATLVALVPSCDSPEVRT